MPTDPTQQQPDHNEQIPFWHDSEDRDRGKDPDYYLTPAELDALAEDDDLEAT